MIFSTLYVDDYFNMEMKKILEKLKSNLIQFVVSEKNFMAGGSSFN